MKEVTFGLDTAVEEWKDAIDFCDGLLGTDATRERSVKGGMPLPTDRERGLTSGSPTREDWQDTTYMMPLLGTDAAGQCAVTGRMHSTDGERGLTSDLLAGEDWQDAIDILLLPGTDAASRCAVRGGDGEGDLKSSLPTWEEWQDATDMLSLPRTGATSQGAERGGVLCTEGERGLMPELLTGEDWQDATDLILLQGTDTAGECTARGVFCTDGGNTSEILTWEDWQDATDSWLLPETDTARQFAVRGGAHPVVDIEHKVKTGMISGVGAISFYGVTDNAKQYHLMAEVYAAGIDNECWYDASGSDSVQAEADGQWYDADGEEDAPRGGKICDGVCPNGSVSDQECSSGGGVNFDENWFDAVGEPIHLTKRGAVPLPNTPESPDDSVSDQECMARGGVIFDESWFDAVGEEIHLTKSVAEPLSDTPDETTTHNKFTNLTSHHLNPNLSVLLEKGPNYALSRRVTSHTMKDVEVGLERGAFAVRWREEIEEKNRAKLHVNPSPDKSPAKSVTLRPRFSDTDTKQAPQAHPVTEHALKKFKQKVMGLYSHHRSTTQNHTKDDLNALTELQKNDSLIVKRSDKCKGLVLMEKKEYIEKTETIIRDYQPVTKNPTKKLDDETSKLIKTTLKGKLPDKTIHAITPNESRTAELYGLPKTHKVNIPLRPIVSACGNPVDKLSWLLERIITQLLVFVPAHLTNTYDYLNHLKTQFPSGFPKGAIAFTVDVNNLYGNIPTAEAIESTIRMLRTHSSKVDLFGLTIPDVKRLLEHCLSNNYVRFGKNLYKQVKGIAMGSRIAPPLAILFMNTVESLMLTATTTLQPVTYLRYIDDIFGIWTHGSSSLDVYFNFINSFHPDLKFSIERSDQSSQRQIPFLDTLLTVNPSGAYTTELYIKPMAAPIILHFASSHPMQTKRSIVHSQSLRALRLGSDVAAQKRGLKKISDLFLSNGYPMQLIKNIQNAAKYKTKNFGVKQRKDTTYVSLPYIDEALTRKVNAAVKSSDLNIRVAWKSGPTLSSKLVRSALEPPLCPRGTRSTCSTCDGGLKGRCHIKNVVYEIKCKICGNLYIGKTRRMIRTRFMEHLGDARNQRKGSDLGDHMLSEHPNTQSKNEDFEISILHTCKDEANLRITESIEIRNKKPALNKNSFSWRLLQPVPYTSLLNI